MNLDLAQRGRIHDAHCVAHGQAFPVYGVILAFAVLRVIEGPLPLTDIFEHGADALVPVV